MVVLARAAVACLLLASGLICSAGLLPTQFTDHDAVRGIIIDARTRKPLASVQITLGTSERSDTVRSRQDGSFFIRARQHIEIPIMGGRDAYVALPVHLFITQPGYAPYIRSVRPAYGSPFDPPKSQDLGIIALTPKRR